MKFFTLLALSAAPLAMAKAVRNTYPGRRDNMLAVRKSEKAEKQGVKQADTVAVISGTSAAEDTALAAQLAAAGLSGAGITSNAATQIILIWVNPGNNAATTNVNTPSVAAPTAAASAAPAASQVAAAPAAAVTHQVTVGGTAGLVYEPAEIQAAVGDMVVFTFMSTNHTVTQSSFTEPCVAMAGGMDSGFQANPNNSISPPPQVAMQVQVATPLWFYCKQANHCGKGMVFSINPTAAKSQAMFQSMAIAINGTGTGSALTGSASGAPPPAASASTAAAAVATGSGSAAGSTTGGATTGSGTIQNGACVCAVTCSAGGFPAASVQGRNAFGGMAGSIPMAMSEPVMNAIA